MACIGTRTLDYSMNSDITEHYVANRQKLVKRMSFRAGSTEAAEDIIQEGYYRALKYYASFNGDNLDRWIGVIINNALREHKNQEKGYTPVEYDELDMEGTPEINYPRHVMREVFELIDTKSPVQIEVLRLYFQQEYSAKDISELTEYTYAKCHQIIQRFREELRTLYK